MIFYLDLLTSISLALMIGTEFAVSAFVNPILWRLDDRSQATAVKAFGSKLGTIMPPWYVVNFLLLIIEAVLRRGNAGADLLLAGCVLWGLVILQSILFLVPINNRLRGVEEPMFSAAERQATRRWDSGHRVRVAALIVTLALFLWALLRPGAAL